MIARRFLYLNVHRLTAYVIQHGQLRREGEFESGDTGLRSFADYLAEHKHSQYSLLVNLADESYAQETIPFLQGSDRKTLITRKMGQHFLGTPLTTAYSLGYEKTQRKNEKLLLSALTTPAQLDPWLSRIDAAEVPLTGIYSISQLIGPLLRKLDLPTGERCLVLSLQDQSIRENFVVEGRTHFSRMAPLGEESPGSIASAFAIEASKLHQYLVGQRLLGRDETVTVFVLAHPDAISEIARACQDRGPLRFSFIDNQTAGERLHLQPLPADNRSETLFIQLLSATAPVQQYAAEKHRHHFRLSQVHQGLIAVGVVALLAGALFAVRETYRGHQLRAEMAESIAASGDLEQRYRAIAATFPQLGIDNDALRQLTSRYTELRLDQRQPDALYAALGQVLSQMPAILLDEIEWRNGAKVATATPTLSNNAPPPGESAIVRGTVRVDRATPRLVLATFDTFIETLRQNPQLHVEVRLRPFDLESTSALRGGDGVDDESRPRQFVIEISRKDAR